MFIQYICTPQHRPLTFRSHLWEATTINSPVFARIFSCRGGWYIAFCTSCNSLGFIAPPPQLKRLYTADKHRSIRCQWLGLCKASSLLPNLADTSIHQVIQTFLWPIFYQGVHWSHCLPSQAGWYPSTSPRSWCFLAATTSGTTPS